MSLTSHLNAAADIMKQQLIELSDGKSIVFRKAGKVFVEKGGILEFHGICDKKYLCSCAGYIIELEIESLENEGDFDVIYELYKLALENKENTGRMSSTGVMGYRKSE